MLRTRLFRFFGTLVAVFGVLSALIGVQFISSQIVNRAEGQVRTDLNSAWSVLNAEMKQVETTLRLTANRPRIISTCAAGVWDDVTMRNELESVRNQFGLDFITLLTPERKVAMRGAPPYLAGDYYQSEPAVDSALRGDVVTGITLMTAQQLNAEKGNLADRAFLVREATPRARPSNQQSETRGMVVLSVVPVMHRNVVVAILYGGVLLNRNEDLVKRIHGSLYRSETYQGVSTGSVTLFLGDCRVATTVRRENGRIALGTLVSKEVADQVLDNGTPWLGRAFVVRDWYLTAYDPIRTLTGETIGMLYVGILEEPFKAMVRQVLLRFALLSFGGIVVTVVLAFLLAGRVARPLHALAAAAHRMRRGEGFTPLHTGDCSTETRTLIEAFNGMASELTDREAALKEMNTQLASTNRSYMETLGFISHEFKTPLGSILNYTFLLNENKLGDLTERQRSAVRNIDNSTRRITEMVRHYLNLSRIENKELSPVRARLDIRKDIIDPLLESHAMSINEKGMRVSVNAAEGMCIEADYNMTLEVFENMMTNALKYGADNGEITIAAASVDGRVEFRVRNTGDGIEAENLDSVFEKFVRLDTSGKSRKKRGTGLGLFITRHIIEAHGGTIRAESKQGEWAEFVFTLPACRETQTNG